MIDLPRPIDLRVHESTCRWGQGDRRSTDSLLAETCRDSGRFGCLLRLWLRLCPTRGRVERSHVAVRYSDYSARTGRSVRG